MKFLPGGLALLVFGVLVVVPSMSEANRGSAGHNGGFRGGGAHVGSFHGNGGSVGGVRRGAPLPARRSAAFMLAVPSGLSLCAAALECSSEVSQ